jgi:dolichyl-phosphate mannosyltransferase polypeptide 2 regulatory subunit
MLVLASTVFAYYTVWTLLMVNTPFPFPPSNFHNQDSSSNNTLPPSQPFVDDSHAIQSLFPPRVWAIRIPVILLLLGGAVVGSFLSVVMVRSNRKKAAKAAKAQQQKAQ